MSGTRLRGLPTAAAFAVTLVSRASGTELPPLEEVDASEPAWVWVAGEGERVAMSDPAPAEGTTPLPGDAAGPPLRLRALRGEVVAFQLVISAERRFVPSATVRVAWDEPPVGVRVERLVEHYVFVSERSRNASRPAESLAWTPAARPADDGMLGVLPDALIPVEVLAESPSEVIPGLAYPFDVMPRQSRAVWIDVEVAPDARIGRQLGEIVVQAQGGRVASIPLELTVQDALLPYRAVSFFAYYGTYELESRFSEAWPEAERSLWQLMHAHHVDAVSSGVTSPDAVERLRGAYDGTWFTPEAGYRGPGLGVGPEVVILGTYGELGEPTPEKAAQVVKLAEAVPGSVDDVLLYAVDEQCDSPRGPTWRRLLSEHAPGDDRRVRVVHTCSEPPGDQDVDLVLMSAQGYLPREAQASTQAGKPVWVYNGQLPHAGPLMLDAPLSSLQRNAWIAAAYGVPRWFLWETTFWNDDNRGGKGPVDVFLNAETFHNRDGDACLYDGLLVYPGTQRGILPPSDHHSRAGKRFEASSFDVPRVLPSMRLKSLRRGIQDAGLIALARDRDAAAADGILAELVPRAFDDVAPDEPTPWSTDAAAAQQARERLRDLIAEGASLTPDAVRGTLRAASVAHVERRDARASREWLRWGAVAGLLALMLLTLQLDRRR